MGYKTDKTSLRVDTRNKCSSIKNSTINLSWSVLYWVNTSYGESKGVWMRVMVFGLSQKVVRKTSGVQTSVFVRSRKPAHLPLHWCEPEGSWWWDLQPCEPMRIILMVLLMLLACPRGSGLRDTTSTSLSGFGMRHHPTLLLQPLCCIIFCGTSGVREWRGGIRHFPTPGNEPWCSTQPDFSSTQVASLWHGCGTKYLHIVACWMCMTSQLLHRRKRVGEWQAWGKTCCQTRLVTALHPTATPVCASHPPADIFSQALGMVSCNWETVEKLSALHKLGPMYP